MAKSQDAPSKKARKVNEQATSSKNLTRHAPSGSTHDSPALFQPFFQPLRAAFQSREALACRASPAYASDSCAQRHFLSVPRPCEIALCHVAGLAEPHDVDDVLRTSSRTPFIKTLAPKRLISAHFHVFWLHDQLVLANSWPSL